MIKVTKLEVEVLLKGIKANIYDSGKIYTLRWI
ncbi:hypothetical protein HOU41_gp019 [Proteus phage Stubb]|uniref:Uncharacterized protein n=1 Tax=Proteus phage Stubb TaxID=2315597 RepID=A0A3B8E0B5_9CAUD|nr:hypothetical protein HOU41_gp019 [Proteus phage Stubb]AYJ73159.1 hypothetical protein CPT_Stubb_019 [Proteus phage Stubb]